MGGSGGGGERRILYSVQPPPLLSHLSTSISERKKHFPDVYSSEYTTPSQVSNRSHATMQSRADAVCAAPPSRCVAPIPE